MKKNWVYFFVICGLTYAWLFYSQYQTDKAYRAQLEQYKADWAAYSEKMDEQARLKDEARKQIDEARKLVEANKKKSSEVAGTATSDEATSDSATLAEISNLDDSHKELLRQVLTVIDPEVGRQTIDTGLYRVVLSDLGAKPIDWEIKSSEFVRNVPENGDPEQTSVFLIPQVGDPSTRSYPFELAGYTARDFNKELFTSRREELDNATRLTFTSDPVNGLTLVKAYTFHHDSYVVDLDVTFQNGPETGKDLGRHEGFGIGWQGGFGEPHGLDRVHGYGEDAVVAVDGKLKTRKVARGDQPDVYTGEKIDWAGQEKKYFTALIIPGSNNPIKEVRTSFDAGDDDPAYQGKRMNVPLSVEIFHAPQRLEPNATFKANYQVYAGPKNREALAATNFNLPAGIMPPSDVVFHNLPFGLSIIRMLCVLLLWLMRELHSLIGVWGIAIIGTTIIVRIIIYPLTHWAIKNQARTMIEQQKIRPEMEAINKKFKNDPMKRNQAVMQLYRDHNVSPFGMLRGCMPMLLQMPVFLALYVVFEQSVELRGQSFLWIQDLSQPDRLFQWKSNLILIGTSFNLLPILMGITNAVQMSIMRMPATDEMQEKIQKQMTYMMPIMFVFFLYQLPSGLILYWIVSNCVSILQSVITKRIIAAHMAAHEAEQKAAKALANKDAGGRQLSRPGAPTA